MGIVLRKPQDLFALKFGDVVTKRNLYELIQYSKIEGSAYWSDAVHKIGNTPQQGINWVGELPDLKAVIIKTRSGAYAEDGWSDEHKLLYRYSFKARKGKISYKETANRVLLSQPQFQYPIFLFAEKKDAWCLEGRFSVAESMDKYVVLNRQNPVLGLIDRIVEPDELQYPEGTRKYVQHLMVERSKSVVKALKSHNKQICTICELDFFDKYGVRYIEAHHIKPVSEYQESYVVAVADLELLCPNCHRAVHIYMKTTHLEYHDIKKQLKNRCQG